MEEMISFSFISKVNETEKVHLVNERNSLLKSCIAVTYSAPRHSA
jgi:hypothetical protein